MSIYMDGEGNIAKIERAYEAAKAYIVYDSFQTIVAAIAFFLIFLKLYEELKKNVDGNKRFDMGAYWGQVRVYIMTCIIAGSIGTIFHLTESVCMEMQTKLITGLGGDSNSQATNMMIDLFAAHEKKVNNKILDNLSFDVDIITVLSKAVSGILMAIGIGIFKFIYTFYIAGRYMWLIMLELVAPLAIVLIIHENTRTYFYNWLKNMIICYLLIPMFLLADKFSNELTTGFFEGSEITSLSLIFLIFTGIFVKIKMFATVKSRASQLF